ncbi:MAG: nickel-dependent hydrogenase large subunit [Chloroflexi bacterium]|nr:nickel-dependent hydrogenase large subunit [Chloroflexota bacterium]
MTAMTIPVGPQHPLLKEPISITLELTGERVIGAKIHIGYVHRGLEELFRRRSYTQNLALVECICGICSHAHTTAYCQAVEDLLGIEIPLRAAYLRVLLCELERIHSHLLWLGVLAEAIGFTTIFMYAWRDREMILDILEELSGGRVAHAANVIGGVRIDLAPDQIPSLSRRLREFHREMDLFRQLVERDRSFHRRTQGIGIMDLDTVHTYGVVGPAARASGCALDIRRDAPYAAYPRLAFEVITAPGGDVWSRALVRLEEMAQSVGMCEQVLATLPGGPLQVRTPARIPPGEAVSRIEAPRGELLYYICSDGSERPQRVKVRTPSLPALSALEHSLPGLHTADIAAVIAGADLCIACADR